MSARPYSSFSLALEIHFFPFYYLGALCHSAMRFLENRLLAIRFPNVKGLDL